MRFRIVTVAILLAVASRGYGRPRDPDPLDISKEAVAGSTVTTNGNGSLDSRQEQHRELKDIPSMDQSLRTVATQLLNTTTSKREDLVRIPEEKIVTIETPMQVVHISTRVEDAISDVSKEEEEESSKMKFGIPVNSKFGHFELSNPGHAMAMTEEEIEREMATATTSGQKNQPTTTSMLSTWIQLYPPSTTTEESNASDVKANIQKNHMPSTTSTKLPSSIVKQTSTNTKPIRKTEKPTTSFIEKSTESTVSSTKIPKTPSTSGTSNFVKISTTLSTTSVENDVDNTVTLEKKPQNQHTTTSVSSTTKSTPFTKKTSVKNSTTPKPKVTTLKNSNTKPQKNNSPRIKPFSTRRPSANKNDTVTSTSKIEKVTVKPSTLSHNRTESTEKPHFITKIKASVLTDAQKTTTAMPITTKPANTILSKSNFTNSESSNSKTPTPTRVNNVLKVHLKKPIDDTTKIEIQPIRVNPPVLTIEKIGDSNDKKTDKDEQDILKNSKVEVKFDFNPEFTNVKLQTPSNENSAASTSSSISTTKRPRSSNKRKKNKVRRRKPSTTTTTTLATPSLDDDAIIDSINNDDLIGIQESKIEPESKAPPSKKKKPNQNTQVQKPIGTQIYNFLSREVMPSVGVMSLVGLGLGLASYFLYPFGGVMARKNYEVEPNYKYNLDEYGGNYGLSEEEVLSKVYSGMTGAQNRDTKYNSGVVGEKNPNYYRYTGAEQPQSTRYLPQKNHGNRVIYRPVETTYDPKYRKTEFRYPDVPTTPNYYERHRQQQLTDFTSTVGKLGIGNNRQFVVGNIPKEYSSAETDKTPEMLPLIQEKVDENLQYRAGESYPEVSSPVATPLTAPAVEALGSPAALVSKVEEELPQPAEIYEEVEITPTAVAIEHGPRSIKNFDDVSKVESTGETLIRKRRGIFPEIASSLIPRFKAARKERSSVIQVIPSKSEIEKERKEEEEEEDLSNEILDIIDEALPGKADHHKKRHDSKDHMTINKQHIKSADNMIKSEKTSTTTLKSISSSSTTTSGTSTTTKKDEKQVPSSTSSTTTTTSQPQTTPTEPDFVDIGETTLDWQDNVKTTEKPKQPESSSYDIIGIAKRIAEIKLRLGLTILKHASENFARYIGHIQKRFNGEE